MNAAAKANLSYEEAYKRLEEAVGELSAGGLSLEEALGRFEQGIALANYCSTLLDRAELRVQQVGQLAPDELSALIDGDPLAEQSTPASGPAAGSAAPGSGPASRRADAGPAAGYPLGGGAGSGGRRGLPPTTGPQRKSASDEPLDPLFDDI